MFLLTPSNLLVLMTLTGAALAATRWARSGRRLMMLAAALLAVGGFTPASTMLIAPLKSRFPDWRGLGRPAPDGVVVLGGAIDANVSALRGHPLELNEAGDRILALIELARRYPSAQIAFTGGSSDIFGEEGVEADEIRKKIGAYGLDPARVIFENRSRTTAENATMTFDLVRPKPGERWLVVTSAWHMPRAMGAFRRAGFNAEAYPVDFRTTGRSDDLRPFGYASGGLRLLDAAVKEWIGLIAYRLTGRTDALLPGP